MASNLSVNSTEIEEFLNLFENTYNRFSFLSDHDSASSSTSSSSTSSSSTSSSSTSSSSTSSSSSDNEQPDEEDKIDATDASQASGVRKSAREKPTINYRDNRAYSKRGKM